MTTALGLMARMMTLVALATLTIGCVPASAIKPVESLGEVGTDNVVVVGKIELIPELEDNEQVLGSMYEDFRNLALVVTDTELREASDQLGFADLNRRIDAPLGDTFFVSHEAQPFFILKSWIVMDAEVKMVSGNAAAMPGNAPLHGAFAIDVKPGDQAVYIGTIRYHRDTFFGTERVEVIDDYDQAQAEFRETFGDRLSLRKTLAMPLMIN